MVEQPPREEHRRAGPRPAAPRAGPRPRTGAPAGLPAPEGSGGAAAGPCPPGVAGTLSPRETEVLRLAARGLPQGAIATALDLSPNTVKTHLRRAAEKLGAASRAESLQVAAARGLVPADDPRRQPARASALAEIVRLAAEQGLLPTPTKPARPR